jgi:hypothetical protein
MIAAEHDQRARLERLHADRDPVDPGGAPRGEVGVGAVGRVGFDRDLDRDLGRARAGEALADLRDRLRDAVGPPQRRRAAAQVDRDQLAGEARRAQLELADDRAQVGLVRRRPDLDREVAVRAQLAAPGEVEVDA